MCSPAKKKDIIAIQSPKGYKCLLCLQEKKAVTCFRTSTFAKHLKAKHQLRLPDVRQSIVEDYSLQEAIGYLCPGCEYFGIQKSNYTRHCQKTCKCDPDFTLHLVQVFVTGHLHCVSKALSSADELSSASHLLFQQQVKSLNSLQQHQGHTPLHRNETPKDSISTQSGFVV